MDGSNQPNPLAGGFLTVLKQRRLVSDIPSNPGSRSEFVETTATTILSFNSKLLRDNLGMVMQGVGVVVPLFATYDKKSSDAPKVFFYDAMGAQFEATNFASSGSATCGKERALLRKQLGFETVTRT